MKTNYRRSKCLTGSLLMILTFILLPMQAFAADKWNAGAAVLLDADISKEDMEEDLENEDEKVVELEPNEATEEIEVKTLTQKNSDLVMAKVNQYVNIRESADQNAEKVGVLYKDCGGHILEQQDGWTKIRSGEVTGWINNDYLYFGEEAEELAKEVGMLIATTQTETLRVRKEPSLEAGVLGLLSINETMEAISEQGDWVEVSYEGTTGYVSAQYVKVDFTIDTAESMAQIKEREAKEAEAKRNAQKEAVLTTASELDILAALIQCEAGGESYEGQIAVGAVVMNRVRCGSYPNTITDVIYASGQFSPASSGKMNSLVLSGNIKASCREAAQAVVNGTCNVGDALHFRRAGNRDGLVIGNHVFW